MLDKESLKESELKSDIHVRLSIKTYIDRLIAFFLLILGCLYLIVQIPEKGVYLFQMFGISIASLKTYSPFMIKILATKFDASTVAFPLYIIIIACASLSIYYILLSKTTEIKVNHRFLEKTYGVFTRTSDSTDLVSMEDQQVYRSVLDRLLGVSKLRILARDKTHPKMDLHALNKDDASTIFDFLKAHAFRNYTEYRISKDIQNSKNNRNEMNPSYATDDEVEE